MNGKKKPINGLLVLTIIAAAMLYKGYMHENQYMNRQFEVFGHIGQGFQKDGPQETDALSNTSNRVGYILPQVVDGFTEEPIEGATVVNPETNKSYKTDGEGYTPRIKVNIISDAHFDGIHPKIWGETTLIAYKEGYIEYVFLHINVWEDQDRKGPKILLFPKNHKHTDQPMSIVEGPNQLWINSLVEKYRPKN